MNTQAFTRLANATGLRGHEPAIWVAMAIQAIRFTGYSISFTYLPLYLYQQRHVPMTIVGSVLLVSGIIAGFAQIAGGMLADRYGHRKTFVAFQLTETFLFALLAVLVGRSSAVSAIFVASAMVMILGNMSAPAISAIVTDVSSQSRLTESFGLMAIAGNLGWAIGPVTGGYLQNVASFAWVFGIGAVVTCFSLVGLPYLPKDRAIKSIQTLPRPRLRAFLSDTNLIIFCAVAMLFYLEMAQWGSTLSVFTVDRIGFRPEQYGLLMSISGVLIILFQYPISRRINWLGFRTALVLGSVLYGLGFLSFGWVKSFVPAIGSIVILVAGEMLFVPASYAVIGKISRLEDRAKSMGLLGLSATTGSSFGPLIGGILLDRFPARPLFLWGPVAIPAFVAALGFLLWRGYGQASLTDSGPSRNI